MVKRSTLSESKFLLSIGTSATERNNEILNSVLNQAKCQQKAVAEDIGIVTSLNDKDVYSHN